MKTEKASKAWENVKSWPAYRCQLSCKIGRDVLNGKTQPPKGVTGIEYALYNLLHAVEELSHAVTDPNRVDKS